MNSAARTLAIAFVAALAGAFLGRSLLDHRHMHRWDLHAVIHDQLDLDADQKQRLDELERQFAIRRTAIENEMRADNALLAEAIESEHDAGPRVDAAVDKSHEAMGRLQKETLAHVFAMRQILRPDQAVKFDQAVVKALTDENREP